MEILEFGDTNKRRIIFIHGFQSPYQILYAVLYLTYYLLSYKDIIEPV